MIWESSFWKQELTKVARRMHKRTKFKRWTERALFLLEKDIFFSFFSIRKLIEAKTKLSKKTSKQKVKLKSYSSLGKQSTLLNWHKLHELFNLCKPSVVSKPLSYLCNQLIHSYVFVPVHYEEGKGLHGIMFCSDYERNTKLFELDVKQIISILERVSNDYPTSITMTFNSDKMDYKVNAECN